VHLWRVKTVFLPWVSSFLIHVSYYKTLKVMLEVCWTGGCDEAVIDLKILIIHLMTNASETEKWI